MSATRVVNLRREPFDVYIGRAGRGKDGAFGNPFQRSAPHCLERFRAYFLERVETDARFRSAVLALRGKVLGCFCKRPDGSGPCHGDIIVEWLEPIEHLPNGPMKDELLELDRAFAEREARAYLAADVSTRRDMDAFFESDGPRKVHESRLKIRDGVPSTADLERDFELGEAGA